MPWKLPANRIVAPNSPSPRANETVAAAPEAAGGERHRDPEHPASRPRPEGPRDVEKGRVDRLEGGDRSSEVERARHEQDRHHDGHLRERKVDAQSAEGVAEQPEAPKRHQQAQPRHRRGHHERDSISVTTTLRPVKRLRASA